MIELLDRHDRNFIRAHSKKGAQQPRPVKVPRPRDAHRPPRRNATGEELAAMMGKLGVPKVPSTEEADSGGD